MPDEEGKLITVPETRPPEEKRFAARFPNNQDFEVNLPRNYEVATLELTAEQRAILEEPIPLEDLDIKPTNEVFASQVHYRRKLNRVFGPGAWALLEQSQPTIKDNTVIQKWALVVKGVFISTAWGEQDYYANNSRQTYATALESAKSNALTRCCKDLGIASECWDKHFCEQFKVTHCQQVRVRTSRNNQGWEYQWRRKDAEPLRYELQESAEDKRGGPPQSSVEKGGAGGQGSGLTPPSRSRGRQPAPPSSSASPKITADQATALAAKINEAQVDIEAICAQFGIGHLEELDAAQHETAIQILNNRLMQMAKRGQLGPQLKLEDK